jgi:hypothetical protein
VPRNPIPLIERFERCLPPVLHDGRCWEWEGGRSKAGYGKILGPPPARKTLLAHRVAWEAHNAEPIPPGLMVCHSCDNPCCVNPSHLFLGSHLDNMADMVRKGRASAQRGAAAAASKLAERDILAIRQAGAAGIAQASIASRFNTTRSNVSAILRGKTWKHLPPPNYIHADRPRGSSHHSSKLTEADVLAIRELSTAGFARNQLASLYGVTPESISAILRRKTWRHI